MPELKNLTPFPNFRYYSRDNENREFGIVIVKATYEIADDGMLVAAEEQAPMLFTDKCHGEVNVSSLWHPSDLVPYKPATDIIVNAVARSPDGKPSPSWECGLSVERNDQVLLEKRLRVTGPRWWRPIWKRELSGDEISNWRDHRRLFDRWKLSEPNPILELPLRYENAFGGEIETGVDDEGNPQFDTDHQNPIGVGKIDQEHSDHTKDIPAPQIEDAGEPIDTPYKNYTPAGFGPIPAAWLPRRPLGGTYDKEWAENVWPDWPKDYSFEYHNSAHRSLVMKPFLEGNETFSLSGIVRGRSIIKATLPPKFPSVDLVTPEGNIFRSNMVLDTVFFDFGTRNLRDWRVFLTWRITFEPHRYTLAVIHVTNDYHEELDQPNVHSKELQV